MGNAKSEQQIGIYLATALVVGNMIGSGIYLLPSSLAFLGAISIYGWIISGLGAILIAILFGRLSKLVPKSGGPYQFPKEGFGEFIGFMSGWGYWVSVVLTNASIAMVFAGYFLIFFPEWQNSSMASVLVTLAAIWFLTWLNARGVRSGGKMQLVTTLLKIIPLIAVTLGGFLFFNIDNFFPMNLSGESDLVAIGAAVSLTLFAFLGIESATVPAGNVKNPTKTIPKATLIGTLVTLFIYILSSISIIGMIPAEDLANSTAPLADAAFIIWGEKGRIFVGLGAIISTFGALNGWILIQGQMPFAMAEDNLLPPIFKKLSKRDFPLYGMLISSFLITIIVLANQSKGLVEIFTMLILFGTFLTLITYLFSSMAEVLILIKAKESGWENKLLRAFLFSIPTFAFSLWAVYGSGMEIVFNGFIILMLGTPFYVWSKIEQNKGK